MAEWTVIHSDTRRPCLTNYGEKCFFHCWTNETRVIPPSALRGGHQGGVVSETFALLEFENGSVARYHVDQFKFIDSGRFEEIDWTDTRKER